MPLPAAINPQKKKTDISIGKDRLFILKQSVDALKVIIFIKFARMTWILMKIDLNKRY